MDFKVWKRREFIKGCNNKLGHGAGLILNDPHFNQKCDRRAFKKMAPHECEAMRLSASLPPVFKEHLIPFLLRCSQPA